MKWLSNLSLTKVVLIAAAFPVFIVGVTLFSLWWAVAHQPTQEGSGGLSAVGFGIVPVLVVGLFPSLIMIAMRAIARWRGLTSLPEALVRTDRRGSWTETGRELRQVVWVVLLLDLIAIGLGLLASRSMGEIATILGYVLAGLVTVAFAIVVIGSLVIEASANRWVIRKTGSR